MVKTLVTATALITSSSASMEQCAIGARKVLSRASVFSTALMSANVSLNSAQFALMISPQLAEVGVIEEVGRARRHAALYLLRAVLGRVIAYGLAHLRRDFRRR